MSRDPIDALLAQLEPAAPPADEFSDALYRRLLPQVRRARGVDHGPIGALDRRLVRLVPGGSGTTARRLLLIAAVTALMLAMAAALIGSRTDPNRLVLTSQATYHDPPPFEMWIEYSNGSHQRAVSDGAGALRVEMLSGPPDAPGTAVDAWTLTVAGDRADWFGTSDTGWITQVPDGATPLHMLDINWLPYERRFQVPANRSYVSCPNWLEAGQEVVAGRPAVHVVCRDKPTFMGLGEAWIDTESGLLLRTDEILRQLDGNVPVTASVSRLDMRPVIDPGLFTMPRPGGRWGAPLDRSASPLPAGRVVTGWLFEPSLAATITHEWWGIEERTAITGFERGGVPGDQGTSAVYVVRVAGVVDQPANRERAATGSRELAAWFEGHPWLRSSPARPASVGGRAAIAVDFTANAPADVGDLCSSDDAVAGTSCWRLLTSGAGDIVVDPAKPARTTLYALDVEGSLVAILASAWGPDFRDDEAQIKALLEGIEFLE